MELIAAEEFAVFVAELPREIEPRLVDGDGVPTAYFKARQRGWTFLDLVAEAKRVLDSGGGVGLIIGRFTALSQVDPVDRSAAGTAGEHRPERVRFMPPPPAPTIPFAWWRERVALLSRISKGGFTADAAGREMETLIADQKNRERRENDPFA